MVKNLTANAADSRDVALIPGQGRSSVEGNGNLLPYSCLGNPMDRGAYSPWTTYSPWGCKELDMTESVCVHIHTHTEAQVNL